MTLQRIPTFHVGIIMDGNGRWAEARGLSRVTGHARGARRVSEIVKACPDLGITHLTLYAFSTENWRRPLAEVEGLMRIFRQYIVAKAEGLRRNDVRVRFIGMRHRVPAQLRELMEMLEARTADCRGLNLTIAIDYGGRDELTRAVRRLSHEVAEGRLAAAAIDEAAVATALDTRALPDPDFIIRTSGELRISNFLLWQGVYAEYDFPATAWPDFTVGSAGGGGRRLPGAAAPVRAGGRRPPIRQLVTAVSGPADPRDLLASRCEHRQGRLTHGGSGARSIHENKPLPRDRDWWRGAVIYQIYPRSFQDSNGDGIGDLAGIIHRLPYVASLGVDAIWISPFFPSPMLDFGYDVMNYRDVDPMFGTLADFDALIERAHAAGPQGDDRPRALATPPTSTAGSARAGRAATTRRPTGTSGARRSPTARRRTTGCRSSAARPGSGTASGCSTIMHNFLKEQPDLNFHEPEVQEELLAVARFWLERGVDGFRLDTINFYFCDAELRDNPVLPPELRDYSTAPAVNPYNWQEHLYDKSRPEMIGFLRRFRALLDEFGDIAAVGEVGDAQRGMEIMGEYTRGDDLMQMCYAFEFLSPEAPSGRRVAQVLRRFATVASDGWACWAFSNHDVERHATRWALDPATAPRLSRAAADAARLGLPLPGRGARADRGLRALRGAAGPLRQALLAEVPRPRRLPHPDGLARATT